jgi:predicted metalloprotease
MRWQGRRQSGNVEDRRGMRVAGGGPAIGAGGLVVLLAVTWLLGGDPMQVLQVVLESQPTPSVEGEAAPGPGSDEASQFVAVVLADTEDTWTPIFAAAGRTYAPPRLVFFTGAVQSACGRGSAASGPFYCPADRKAYIDLSFYDELRSRFGAPGDFAQAYVIAHEVGHHVQNLLGTSDKVQRARQRASETDANALSVRLELQADCLAGVWGHTANRERKLLEEGDVEEGLAAAAAIGDDRLQKQSQGRVSPESWTHGSSEQRVRWLRVGLESGDIDACDTFAAGFR